MLVLAVIGAAAFTGCRTNSHGGDVQVRLINAVPDSGSLTVSVDGQRVWKNAGFRSSTGYQGMAAGTYGVRVDSDNLSTTLLEGRPLSFEKNHRYTVLALGRVMGAETPARVQVLEDDSPSSIPAGKVEVRLIQASPGTGAVDLVVNNIVGVKSVGYGRRSEPLILTDGTYDLKVVAADTPDALAGPISLRLDSGHAYTLVTMGQASTGNMSLEAYPDNP